tara:strand:+ start:403 stop:531 length:129 start_codon:yes stop_codon:yes gene_type:complete
MEVLEILDDPLEYETQQHEARQKRKKSGKKNKPKPTTTTNGV